MLKDKFYYSSDSLLSPAQVCFPIVPHDSQEIPQVTKAIYVGIGGDITLRTVKGPTDVTFVNVPSGAILDVRVLAVRDTGTSAHSIVGLA